MLLMIYEIKNFIEKGMTWFIESGSKSFNTPTLGTIYGGINNRDGIYMINNSVVLLYLCLNPNLILVVPKLQRPIHNRTLF